MCGKEQSTQTTEEANMFQNVFIYASTLELDTMKKLIFALGTSQKLYIISLFYSVTLMILNKLRTIFQINRVWG